VIASALAVLCAWAVFFGAGVARTLKNPTTNRPVVYNGQELGFVELKPLKLKNRLWRLEVFFEPVDQNLGIVREHQLRWWQVVDREGWEGYPRMDLQRGTGLPGSPGDDDDPAYYTRNEKLGIGGHFSPEEIFRDNKYWLRDAPQPEEVVSFEAWLIWQGDHEFVRLLGFEWGLDAHEGEVWRIHQPRFISESRYDLPRILEQSGFSSRWRDKTKEIVSEY